MKTITDFIGAIFTWIGRVFSEPILTGPFYFSADVGNVTHWETSLPQNVFGLYAVTAYDIWGRESDFSNMNLDIYVRGEGTQPK